jgi:hypothetical protein
VSGVVGRARKPQIPEAGENDRRGDRKNKHGQNGCYQCLSLHVHELIILRPMQSRPRTFQPSWAAA